MPPDSWCRGNRLDPVRTIILDFDGVLLESNDDKMQAFEDLFALHPKFTDAMRAFHLANYSRPRMIKFEHYVYQIMERPGDENAVQEMARQFSEIVTARVIACREVPGAGDFLKGFSKKVPLYISSTTPQEELIHIIEARGMAHYFTEVFGDPPVEKAVAIQRVLEREQCPPSEVVFVGDAVSDYLVATEAKLQFLGRNSGLPFDGQGTKLYRDMAEIGDVLRTWIKE
jgi:phosphoglycolate phosphatase-like HAD superfamily hydrolase